MKKLTLVMIILAIGLSGCMSGTKKQEDNIQKISKNAPKTEQQSDKSDLDALKNMYGSNLVPVNNDPPVYIQAIPEIPKDDFYWKNKSVGNIKKNNEYKASIEYGQYKTATLGEGILKWINDRKTQESFIYYWTRSNMAVCFFSSDNGQPFGATEINKPEFDTTISSKLIFFFLNNEKEFYWYELSRNAFPLTKEVPFSIFDIDNNGMEEVHFRHDDNIYEIIGIGNRPVEFDLIMSVDINNVSNVYEKNNFPIIKTYKEYGTGDCIMAIKIGSVAGFVCPDYESRIHLVRVSGEDLTDVSYMFPNILRGLWTPEKLRSPFEKYIFLEQIGPLNQYRRNALTNKIKEKREIEIVETLARFSLPLQAEDSYEHEKWYNREAWLHVDNFRYNKFPNYKDAWKTLKEAIDKKTVLSYEDIEELLFFNDSKNMIFIHSPYQDKPFEGRSWEIEPGSYWPERRLGKHEMAKIDYSNKGDLPQIKPESFERDLIKFANFTLGGRELTWNRGKFIADERNYMIIPASEDIIFIVTDYPPCMTAIKLGNEANSYKPTQLIGWFEGDMAIIVNGIGDVNCDGVRDFVFQFQNFGATENTNDTTTFSVINGQLHQLVMDVEGLGSVEYFFGSFGGRGHYGTLELGCAPVPDSIFSQALAAFRFSSMHRMELREDGSIYDITYNYPTPEHINSVKEIQNGNYFFRRTICNCETVGLSKIALKNIPKGSECNDDDCRIYRDCLLLGKTYYVQSPEDAIKNWSIYHPHR
ncbi:MAG: hypothetical protein GX421_00705 [Caldisericales bacterium]|nr:hypothetical protein [Caldisericales bacterium]